jgi:hypothetical protein
MAERRGTLLQTFPSEPVGRRPPRKLVAYVFPSGRRVLELSIVMTNSSYDCTLSPEEAKRLRDFLVAQFPIEGSTT